MQLYRGSGVVVKSSNINVCVSFKNTVFIIYDVKMAGYVYFARSLS